jgi:hypothetical protein
MLQTSCMSTTSIERRVARAAERALAERGVVTPIDVLVGVGWLHSVHIDLWRQGRVAHLEELAQVDPSRLHDALGRLQRWAVQRGLVPAETSYVARTLDRRTLLFSANGDADVERAYRTQWLSPSLTVTQQDQVTERTSRPADVVVISPLNRDWTCRSCSGTGGLLIMDGPGPLCLTCAGMDHLVYLPAGDAALTRRAKRASRLSAVVVRFSRARKRYERQGILVEEAALEEAERECLGDEEAQARRRLRGEARRSGSDPPAR